MVAVYDASNLRVDFIRRARPINSMQSPRAAVVFKQRRGLSVVSFQSHPNVFFRVVSSMNQIHFGMVVAFAI